MHLGYHVKVTRRNLLEQEAKLPWIKYRLYAIL